MSTGRTTPPPSARPPGASRHGWFVGVLAVLALVYISVNTLRTHPIGVQTGAKLPAFAVPRLFANTGDVPTNLIQKAADGAPRPACRVRDPRALNVCTYAANRPLVLAFASEKEKDTLRQLDAMRTVASHFPRVRFVGIFLRGDRDEARKKAKEGGWGFPLGWDPEATVAEVYGLKALPAIFLVDSARRARAVEYRVLAAPELARRVRRLR